MEHSSALTLTIECEQSNVEASRDDLRSRLYYQRELAVADMVKFAKLEGK